MRDCVDYLEGKNFYSFTHVDVFLKIKDGVVSPEQVTF